MLIGMSISLPSSVITLVQRIKSIFTRISPNGHMWLPGASVPTLGPELVTNGSFDSDTAWTKGAGWTISGGVAVASSATGTLLSQSIGTVAGKSFLVTAKCSSLASGSWNFYVADKAISGSSITTSGTFSVVLTPTIAGNAAFIGNASCSGTFDDVSVKEITGYTSLNNGFSANNYLDSAGTTPASTDGLVGLALDAAGSVGSELVSNPGGPFASTAGYTAANSVLAIVAGELEVTNTLATTGSGNMPIAISAGKTYKIQANIRAGASNSVANSARLVITVNGAAVSTTVVTSNGVNTPVSFYFSPTSSVSPTISLQVASGGAAGGIGDKAYASIISVKEITGIHASQPTVGSKPYERRGIVNTQLNSHNVSGSAWSSSNITRTGADVITAAANDQFLYCPNGGTTPDTAAFLLSRISGSGVVQISANAGDTYTSVTLTSEPTLFVASNAAGSRPVVRVRTSGDSVRVGGIGLFQGTLTAQQILSYGGIPLTTTAAASSTLGPQYWQFDGVDDRLTLSAVPFGTTDDFCVVVSFAPGSVTSDKPVFCARSGAALIRLGGASSDLDFYMRDDALAISRISVSSTLTVGAVLVATFRRSGGVSTLRKNGALIGTNSTAMGVGTITAANIGFDQATSLAFSGNIYDVQAHKGTFTDAEIVTMEAYAAKCAGGRLLNGSFVSDF